MIDAVAGAGPRRAAGELDGVLGEKVKDAVKK
jgi:hypothetical protein